MARAKARRLHPGGFFLPVFVIGPTPASGVPNGVPLRDVRTSSARHVLQPARAPALRPAILRHRVLPWTVW
jgi:hypothetical protein